MRNKGARKYDADLAIEQGSAEERREEHADAEAPKNIGGWWWITELSRRQWLVIATARHLRSGACERRRLTGCIASFRWHQRGQWETDVVP